MSEKKQRKPKKTVSESKPTAEPVSPQVESVPPVVLPIPEPELSPVEKVEIMNGLAMSVRDPAVKRALCGSGDNLRPSGDLVYKVFVEAINDKISEIMNGKQGLPPHANSISALMGQINATMAQIGNTMGQTQNMMRGWMTNPVSQTMNVLVKKLGGEEFHFDAHTNDNILLNAQQQQAYKPPPPQQQPQQQQQQQRAQQETSQPRRTNGDERFQF
jgi:hypothetical protein